MEIEEIAIDVTHYVLALHPGSIQDTVLSHAASFFIDIFACGDLHQREIKGKSYLVLLFLG